ncbi:MAG: hypothetical protein O7A08_01365 [SAR324 cluster bacterium]|nr:hypothetical protein [SAR324 cluster bacterium]MCZ6531594.1 hypothetical protein [SAR324 cluster bacterium]MCZ6556244.1 hypothetical protein [SAR324 cluster bacterium]MCZ6628543.1 hypothetical protein [SAR324 cluster bacterium]MCZ6841202.1 hypothetical protein [SAR324 cluster bacterium]
MSTKSLGAKGEVTHFYSKDGRMIGLLVAGDFDDYASFPPFLESETDKQHLNEAYQGVSAEREAATKAHLTADELPMQIVLLNRDPGSKVNPHYHVNVAPAESATRHQIMICKQGKARIGLYTREGEHVDTIELGRNDLILMTEGHSIEFVEPDTRLVEIKMGPFPETDAADKVDIDADLSTGV